MFKNISELETQLLECAYCPLNSAYNKGPTSYNGSAAAKLMLVGEGPGEVEDTYGVPLVGQSGQLLDKALSSVGITRDCVYTTNVIKCRPRGNRTPTPQEGQLCAERWLKQEIALVQPVVIVALGSVALKYLKNGEARITKDRGQWFRYQGIDTIATYHPAYLLRLTGKQLIAAKWDVYHDLQAAVAKLREALPDYRFTTGTSVNLLAQYQERAAQRNLYKEHN